MADDPLCARCGCYRSAHGEDERCEPVGWSFAMPTNPQKDEIERVVKIGLGQVRYILRSVQNGDDQREAAGKAIQIVDAAIAAMGRENEVLREALEPFADAARACDDNSHKLLPDKYRITLTLGECRVARAALTNTLVVGEK
jgi:hypothetical protein